MDKSTVQQVGLELRALVAELGTKHGLKFEVGTMRYNATSFRCTLEAHATDDSGADLSAKAEFERCCYLVGLQPADFGATFETMSGEYCISGLSIRSPKRPILATREGRTYKFPSNHVVLALRNTRARAEAK